MHSPFPTIASLTISLMHPHHYSHRVNDDFSDKAPSSLQTTALPPIENTIRLFVEIVQTSPVTRHKMQWKWQTNHTFRIENGRKNTQFVIRNQIFSMHFAKSNCFYHLYPESNYASQSTTESHIPIVQTSRV